MAMNYEFERHIKAAEDAGNINGAIALRIQQAAFNGSKDLYNIEELTREENIFSSSQTDPAETEKIEIKRFSDETREALIREGYVIYTLEGLSIRDHRESGRNLETVWKTDKKHEYLETHRSIMSEIAINPDSLFIPGSNRKNLEEQQKLISEFGSELSERVKGIEVIMGDAADYLELAFAHLYKTSKEGTPEYLFGEKYNYKYARTKTPYEEIGHMVCIGGFSEKSGLLLDYYHEFDRRVDVFAAPLVAPQV